jgi:hypothetical protein
MTALAMKQAGIPPAAKIVLYWLAHHHNGETGLCFPSLNTLATRCEMSKSTLARHLNDLEARGLILRATRQRENGSNTSTSYTLHFPEAGTGLVPKQDKGCPKIGQGLVPKCAPHNLGTINQGIEQEVATLPCAVVDHFPDFWDAYPHRNGAKKNRKGAEASFSKALKLATPEQIAMGVEAMRNSPDVLRGYARDPATWLNQQGWQDEISDKPQHQKGASNGNGNTKSADYMAAFLSGARIT